MANDLPQNLYVHFPFCRRKCTYCVLPSRAGVSQGDRDAYVRQLAEQLEGSREASGASGPGSSSFTSPAFKTIYFGGGSPGLCNLAPLGEVLAPLRDETTEFTVELHPLDVTRERLQELKGIGVNRISMGVQSLDDEILRQMGRGYTFADAERAFFLIKDCFDNAGIDLIVGYPGESSALSPRWARLAKWGLRHCSVYSLILEECSILVHQIKESNKPNKQRIVVPEDDVVLNRIAIVSRFLKDIGLERYEISNYAAPGCECRHNLATWRGEDYLGLGDGGCGRTGLRRSRGRRGPDGEILYEWESVSPEQDEKERTIFRLRTREGLDTTGRPEWIPVLDAFVSEGLLEKEHTSEAPVYRLTERGTEVCDTILAELV